MIYTPGLDSNVETNTSFQRTMEFFTHWMRCPVVLAGGCIRDAWMGLSSLIRDYDVFVLGVDEGSIAPLDDRLGKAVQWLNANPENPKPLELVVKNLNYPDRKYHAPKANLRLPWVPDGIPVQVMYTPCTSMQDLVDQFDWHVCSFAFDGQTVISSGVSDFESNTLTLNPENALRSARSTLRRGFHLEDKFRGTAYRLKMPNETILALAAMLTLSAEDNNRKTSKA